MDPEEEMELEDALLEEAGISAVEDEQEELVHLVKPWHKDGPAFSKGKSFRS